MATKKKSRTGSRARVARPGMHPIAEPDQDVFFFKSLDVPESPDREYEDIILRRVPRPVAHRFRGAAGARALTHAQYLSALINLHDADRKRADGGDRVMAAALEQLGLQTVSI